MTIREVVGSNPAGAAILDRSRMLIEPMKNRNDIGGIVRVKFEPRCNSLAVAFPKVICPFTILLADSSHRGVYNNRVVVMVHFSEFELSVQVALRLTPCSNDGAYGYAIREAIPPSFKTLAHEEDQCAFFARLSPLLCRFLRRPAPLCSSHAAEVGSAAAGESPR
jgi:hypothetical protein